LDIPPGITAFLDIPVELIKRDLIINNKSYAKTPDRVKLEGGSYEIVFRITTKKSHCRERVIH